MKKLILLFLPLLSVLANAEELKFVTVLSSPVGTFNKLEAVDSVTPAKSPVINFCTSIGTGGTVTLKGTSKPEMKTVNLSQNTTLGREDTGNYVLNQITMKSGGTLKGSRLLAGTVQVNQATAGKSDKLYTETLTVAGAKAGKLYVNGKEAYIETEASDPGMMWSNQYQSDKACGDKCKDQYLLKEKREIIAEKCPETPGDPRTWWDESAQKCGCPNANEYYHNGACCSESNKEDSRCWSPNSWVTWYGPIADNPTETKKPRNCMVVDGRYPYLRENSSIEPEYDNIVKCKQYGPCSVVGEAGVSGCGFPNVAGTVHYDKIMIFIAECRKGYPAAWYEETVDTRYSCGH